MYEAYAAIYDAIGQARLGAQLAGWVLGWLADCGAAPQHVLDLACGTGMAAQVFAAAGCRVVGVDRARPMLEIARGRARDAGYQIVFVEGDIRALATTDEGQQTTGQPEYGRWSVADGRSSFDLATCFYDSLNYLVGDGDLDRVFGGVAAALRPGGWWVFDLNTEAVFLAHHECDIVTYDGPDMLVYNQVRYERSTRRATARIVWFVRELGRWWRGEETHTERAWAGDEVAAALDAAGFALVARLAPGGAPAADDSYRVIYIAQKKGLE